MSDEWMERLRGLQRYRDLSVEGLRRIADLAARLRKVSLFSSLSDQDLAVIAEKGQLESFERGDMIIHEGDTDQVFYVILKGQVRVWRKDQQGGRRLLNYHEAGDFFGELAFWNGAPRAANVDVIDDVELVAFDREGFRRIVQHPRISDYLQSWGQERIRRSNQPFRGKHWDEISIIHAHKSRVALARMVFFPAVIILLTWAVSGSLLISIGIPTRGPVSVIIAVTVGIGMWIFWMWEDWRNDDFIVTSKRIIQVERILVPPFPVERHEVSIGQVQDITTLNHGLWTRLFDVHSLEIKTSGAGIVRFPFLTDADRIREEIFHARDLSRTRRLSEERSRIREKLFKELNRPVKTFVPLKSGESTVVTPERTGLLKALDYFVPRTRVVKPDRIIWRKHWLVLLREVGPALVALVLSAALLALGLARPGILRQVPRSLTTALPSLLVLVSLGFCWWFYDGWCNDIYIVTDTRIVDIEGSPFHLRKETRTEGTFDVIQNIDYSSPGWLARILRIGDVTIDTASQRRAFSFESVARPEAVQQEIFKRLTAFRESRAREESERQYTEFARWFDTYHRSVIEQKE